ncbi:hypothetical protein AB0C51_10505 [Streptomyces pathocidini]|uniref:hypothetical protein n=1 Tax=Streptomyces pathocidini TaxID=1650571 RepID=UPI0033C5F162
MVESVRVQDADMANNQLRRALKCSALLIASMGVTAALATPATAAPQPEPIPLPSAEEICRQVIDLAGQPVIAIVDNRFVQLPRQVDDITKWAKDCKAMPFSAS